MPATVSPSGPPFPGAPPRPPRPSAGEPAEGGRGPRATPCAGSSAVVVCGCRTPAVVAAAPFAIVPIATAVVGVSGCAPAAPPFA
jgi:hypothetical protein